MSTSLRASGRPAWSTTSDARRLRAIAAGAARLDEWLALDARHTGRRPNDPSAEPAIAALLAEWQGIVADGDAERFDRRLAWDGLTRDDVARILDGRHRAASGGSARTARWMRWTRWTRWLPRVAAEAVDLAAIADRAATPSGATPIAFEEALLPFVRVARARLARRRGGRGTADPLALPAGWTTSAIVDVERGLLRRLASVAEQTLDIEFTLVRASAGGTALALAGALSGSTRTSYDRFVGGLLAGGWWRTWETYPVLARLLCLVARQWVANTHALERRLARDRRALATLAGGALGSAPLGTSLGDVQRVQTGLSDPHRGGRAVCILELADGRAVVYKPRPLGLEVAFGELLDEMSDTAPRRLDPPLRAPRIVARAAYGWVEHVAPAPCDGPDALERYYRRAGALLCFAYVLGAADLHGGNVFARGEHPVLVDLEVLLAGLVRNAAAEPGDAHPGEGFWNSVLRTALLPGRVTGGEGITRIEGGYAGMPPDATWAERRWVHPNTDRMRRALVRRVVGLGANIPRLGDVPQPAVEHTAAIADGFTDAYRALCIARDAAGGAAPLLARFATGSSRVILRSTSAYDALLRRSVHPNVLRDGVRRSVELERLLAPFTLGTTRPALWAAWRSEQTEMERLDVPVFTAPVDDAAVVHHGGTVPDALSLPGLAHAIARVERMDERDLELQRHCIRVALTDAAIADSGFAMLESPAPAPLAPTDAVVPLTPERAVAEARALAECLTRLAAPANDGGATWVAFPQRPGGRGASLELLGHDLYGGRAGIALFLAAAARATGDARLAATARAALVAPVRAAAAGDVVDAGGIGGISGAGGIAWALLHAGRLLDDAAYVDAARQAARAITPDRIAADTSFDLVFGAAGAALALLALHDALGEPWLLDRAARCGDRLLDARLANGGWPSFGGAAQSGLAHGASGAILALVRLHARTGRAAYGEAARDALRFEHTCFDPALHDWHDVPRTADAPTSAPWTSWCHGAAGIGLARAAVLPYLRGADAADAADDLRHAVAAVDAAGLRGVDHPCCGALGRAELLVAAGRALGDAAITERGGQLAARVIARARHRGAYVLSLDMGLAPSLFQGVAGVGYQLLRVAAPDTLPSILTLS